MLEQSQRAAATHARQECSHVSTGDWDKSRLHFSFRPQAEKMSAPTERELQWRQQRAELYEELYAGGKTALNREGVRKTRCVSQL
jgi:hypothetical protein